MGKTQSVLTGLSYHGDEVKGGMPSSCIQDTDSLATMCQPWADETTNSVLTHGLKRYDLYCWILASFKQSSYKSCFARDAALNVIPADAEKQISKNRPIPKTDFAPSRLYVFSQQSHEVLP